MTTTDSASETPPTATQTAIAFEQVRKEFGKGRDATLAVDDVDLAIGEREFVSLIGPSGCGKSTLLRLAAEPPVCAACAGLIRPGVVWFGELLDANLWEQAYAACQQAQVMLVVGTSGLVWPAAELPLLARRAGAHVVEVNPEDTELTGWADTCVRGRSGEILPLLADQVERIVS